MAWGQLNPCAHSLKLCSQAQKKPPQWLWPLQLRVVPLTIIRESQVQWWRPIQPKNKLKNNNNIVFHILQTCVGIYLLLLIPVGRRQRWGELRDGLVSAVAQKNSTSGPRFRIDPVLQWIISLLDLPSFMEPGERCRVMVTGKSTTSVLYNRCPHAAVRLAHLPVVGPVSPSLYSGPFYSHDLAGLRERHSSHQEQVVCSLGAGDYDDEALVRSAINSPATSKLNSLHCRGRTLFSWAIMSLVLIPHKLFTDPVNTMTA